MGKDLRTRAFLIHLAAYVVVTAICAAINLWLAPHYLWFVWLLVGWGIGIAAHGLALLLRKTHRRKRLFIDPKARGFTVDLFAYVAVIVLLFIINFTITPKVWWFYWVALGWGAGVLFHAWCAFGKRRVRSGRTLAQRMTSSEEAAEPKSAAKPQPTKSKPAAAPRQEKQAPKNQNTPRKKPAAPRKRPKPKA
jgi:hypothetical protein